MHPDGGIARFRAYGRVLPAPLEVSAQNEVTDLAFVLNGGRVSHILPPPPFVTIRSDNSRLEDHVDRQGL